MARICGNPVLSGACKRLIIERCTYTCGAIRPLRESSATNMPTARPLKDLADWIADAPPDDSYREWPQEIASMLRIGSAQEVEPDLAAAANDIGQAQLRLRSARRILSEDPGGAISGAWEAIRLALTAHMLANGLRATSRHGGFHIATAQYGIVALGPLDPDAGLERLDEARDLRAAVSYRHVAPERRAAEGAIGLAARVVGLVRDELGA